GCPAERSRLISGSRRTQFAAIADARADGRFQAAAAPPERVSGSLTNEVRCGDAEGSLSDRGCEGRDLGAARGGGERGRDQSPARYAEADGEQVPAADGRGPAEGTPSGGVLPDLG